MGEEGSAELMTGVASAWEVLRRDVSTPEVIAGLDGGWDVPFQGVLVSKAWEVWRRDVSTPPEVIEGLDGGLGRLVPEKVLGCEWRPRRRDVASPTGFAGFGRVGSWRATGMVAVARAVEPPVDAHVRRARASNGILNRRSSVWFNE